MFQATERETLILHALKDFQASSSNHQNEKTEETVLFEKLKNEFADDFLQFQFSLSGCIAKNFMEKSEKNGKSFYKITEDGLKQI